MNVAPVFQKFKDSGCLNLIKRSDQKIVQYQQFDILERLHLPLKAFGIVFTGIQAVKKIRQPYISHPDPLIDGRIGQRRYVECLSCSSGSGNDDIEFLVDKTAFVEFKREDPVDLPFRS